MAAETPYTYRIKAINDQGVSERSRWFHIDTPASPTPESDPALLAPANLTAATADGQVFLSWDAPVEDTGSVTGYEILRGQGEDDPTTLVADTGIATTTYTDETATQASTVYAYRVKAIRDGELSQASNEARVHLPPAAPPQVLSAASHDSVLLSWDDPDDDTITGYRIMRSDIVDQVQGEFAVLNQDTGSTDTTYTDDTVEPERSYVYRVLAISPHGVSAPSHDVEAHTPADPNPPVPEREGVQDLGDITEQDGPQFNRGALEGAADAAHYYRFTLSEPRSVRLALDWQEGDAALVLELEDGTRLRVRVPDGDDHASVEETLLEGTHYARVEARQQGENEYLFTYEVSEASAADVELLREEGYTPDPEPGEATEPLDSQPAEVRQEAEQVLLSNFGQTTSAGTFVVGTFEIAQGFRTGPNIPGYTLSSIELQILAVPDNPADVTLELWSATSNGTPNAPVATLTHSTGTWEIGLNTLNAPADTELAAGTTFFVFASYPETSASDGLELEDRQSTSADDGGAPGWSVRQIFERSRTSQGSWSSRFDALKIQFNGHVVLVPSSSDTPGTVVLSAASPFSASQPYTGIQLTAELTDPDPVANLEWQWHRSLDGSDWRKIPGATSISYTPTTYIPTEDLSQHPVGDDESHYLRATASYKQTFTDGTVDRTAHGVTGGYTRVDISEPPGVDFANDNSSPGRVRVGRWVTGAIRNETGTGGDVFAVDLERGRKYRIDLEGAYTGRGSLADPLLRV